MEPVFRTLEIAATIATRAAGTAITYQGLQNIPERGGAVIAINHTSYIDFLPAALATHRRHRRMRFMIKAEMTDVRIVAFLIKHTGAIPVDRSAGADSYAEAVRQLRAGELVGVYPEATISRSFELKEFKSGAVRMALEARVPIIPSSSGAPTGCGPRTIRNSWAATRYRSPSGWAPVAPGRHAGRTRCVDAGRDDHHAARGAGAVSPSRRCPLGAAPPRRWGADAGGGRPHRGGRTRGARPPGGRATLMLPALIATDVDGTLLDADERVTLRTRQAVLAAVAAGTEFVLATGRPRAGSPRWSTRSGSRRWRCAPTVR